MRFSCMYIHWVLSSLSAVLNLHRPLTCTLYVYMYTFVAAVTNNDMDFLLHCYIQEAEVLAHKDKLRLLKTRKLTLVVDLDQTLIHTSTDPHIEPGLPVSNH